MARTTSPAAVRVFHDAFKNSTIPSRGGVTVLSRALPVSPPNASWVTRGDRRTRRIADGQRLALRYLEVAIRGTRGVEAA